MSFFCSMLFGLRGCPWRLREPESWRRKPDTMFMKVLFPAPFGPSRPKKQPVWIERLSSWRARVVAKVLLSDSAWRIVIDWDE